MCISASRVNRLQSCKQASFRLPEATAGVQRQLLNSGLASLARRPASSTRCGAIANDRRALPARPLPSAARACDRWSAGAARRLGAGSSASRPRGRRGRSAKGPRIRTVESPSTSAFGQLGAYAGYRCFGLTSLLAASLGGRDRHSPSCSGGLGSRAGAARPQRQERAILGLGHSAIAATCVEPGSSLEPQAPNSFGAFRILVLSTERALSQSA